MQNAIHAGASYEHFSIRIIQASPDIHADIAPYGLVAAIQAVRVLRVRLQTYSQTVSQEPQPVGHLVAQ